MSPNYLFSTCDIIQEVYSNDENCFPTVGIDDFIAKFLSDVCVEVGKRAISFALCYCLCLSLSLSLPAMSSGCAANLTRVLKFWSRHCCQTHSRPIQTQSDHPPIFCLLMSCQTGNTTTDLHGWDTPRYCRSLPNAKPNIPVFTVIRASIPLIIC